MHPPVIDLLDPRGEQHVQLHQVVEFAAGADLDEELIPHGAGRLGRAARCQRGAGPFPLGLPPNRTYPFPGIRLSGDYCVSAAAGCPWIRSWQSPQTTRALRRILAMTWAHGGCGCPVRSRSASVRTWCTQMLSVRLQSSHLPLSSRVTSCRFG